MEFTKRYDESSPQPLKNSDNFPPSGGFNAAPGKKKPTFKFTPYTPEKKEEFLRETDALLQDDGYYEDDAYSSSSSDDDEYEYDSGEDEDYYYNEREDYRGVDELHPSYQSAFFKEDSPIGKFIAERNEAYAQK